MAYSTKNEIVGDISYNKDIILSIVRIATNEVLGISALAENFGSALKRWFSNNYNDGVRVYYNANKIGIDVYVNVKFGYNVSDIAFRVQENIKNSLTSMLNIQLDKINVHVLGVDFSKE